MHRFTFTLDSIDVEDDTVAYGGRQCQTIQVFVPFAGIILRTEDSGGYLILCLYLLEMKEQPLIVDEWLLFS